MGDGLFYLGKNFSVNSKKVENKKFLYETEDLTTHAVVFGMTGSGKTGLCITMLEEAIEEDIPIIVVDPKGDVSNLSLIFPDMKKEDFKKWVSPVEARKEGMTIEEYSEKIANMWKNGLKEWDVSEERIKNIKEKADIRIFTPGSSSGLSISILEGFKKPEESFEEDEEALVEKIRNSVSALLSLLDIESDPLKSKPHILISNIIEYFWRRGESISIEELILNIQKPPIKKLGVFDINQIIDERERIELAFKINNIVASPSFRFWTSGMPLSAERLYKRKGGKVPVNIFYIAHLSENERMFFVSLLLNEILFWIRKQEGTSDLKYIFYMDEIFGYLPPYPLNPPSKTPLLLLLKQARAFGLGVVLVTQNPKDIDYKGLTNAGSWFIGRLQAEGDKERVAEGLEGLSGKDGEIVDGKEAKEYMSSLKKRVFMIKNVHKSGISFFHTRWAISYLTGPLTREQIRDLKPENIKQEEISETVEDKKPSSKKIRSDLLPYLPTTEIQIKNYFETSTDSSNKFYQPYFLVKSEIVFDENKYSLYIREKYNAEIPAYTNDFEINLSKEEREYSSEPDDNVLGYKPFSNRINYSSLNKVKKQVKNHLFTNLSLKLFINKELNLVSKIGENEDDFRFRCREVVEKKIDKEVEKLKESYERKIDRIKDRIERERLRVQKLEAEYGNKKVEEYLSIGESVLGLLLGSKSRRVLSTAARKRRMTKTTESRIKEGKMKISQYEEDLESFKEELEDKIADLEDKYYEIADNIEEYEVRLEKDDILISEVSILWKLQN